MFPRLFKKSLKIHTRTQCGVCSLPYEEALNLKNTHKYQIINYFIHTIYIRIIERREKIVSNDTLLKMGWYRSLPDLHNRKTFMTFFLYYFGVRK